MWRRYLVSLFIVCATFFLLGGFPGQVVAHDGKHAYISLMRQPAGADDLVALFKHTPVPARLYGLEGSDSLAVGEEGRFRASANIDAASLPLRFRWDFGDGTTASGLHARHHFTAPGTYPVTFSLSNSHSEATDTLFVTVVPPVEDEPTACRASDGDGRVKLAEIDLHRLGHHLDRLCESIYELCLR